MAREFAWSTFWWRGWFDNPARPELLVGLGEGSLP
jgi:hypothetical protein